MEQDVLFCEDSITGLEKIPRDFVHLVASDIPYGIGMESWDVIHENSNSAYLGSSPAQQRAGKIFSKRGY